VLKRRIKQEPASQSRIRKVEAGMKGDRVANQDVGVERSYQAVVPLLAGDLGLIQPPEKEREPGVRP